MGNKIVLVDDDQLVLLSVSHALEASGYQVWATDSTEQAFAHAQEVNPDVVVTDYRMPGMDGVSLLARLRELRAVPLMVVYSATPPPGGGPRQRLRDVYWVVKSAGHQALLEKLRDLLGGGVDRR